MDRPLSAQLLLITGQSSIHLAPNLIASLIVRPAKISLKRFADDEMLLTILESLKGKTLLIIQSTPSPASLIELFLLIDAAKSAGAKHILVTVPYFGYGRQDRHIGHSSLGAALMARLLETAGADAVLIIDPHNPALAGFFRIPAQTLMPIQLFIDAWDQHGLDLGKLVLVAPDVGSYKRSLSYARALGDSDPVVLFKERTGADQCRVSRMAGSVNGRPVMLVDDLISSGSTLLQAAELLVKRGATAVYATATHLVTQQTLPHLNQAPIDHLFVTDSLPHQITHPKITIVSLVPLLVEAVGRFQPPPKQPTPPFNHPSHIPSFIGSGNVPLAG